MFTTILKARSFAITSISPDGLLLAASDSHDYLYIVDLQTGELLFEQELERDLESLNFDRSGQRLFLNDGIMVKVIAVPGFSEILLPAVDNFEDPTGLKFLDSKVSGEILFFLPTNGNIYCFDPSGERWMPLAFVPYDTIDGQYLGTESNKLILSALERSPRVIVANLAVENLPQKLPRVCEWEEAELLGVASDGRTALLQHNNLVIRDLNLAELSRWQLPAPTPAHLCAISCNLDTLCVIAIESSGCFLFDSKTGERKGYITTGSIEPTQILFVERSRNRKLVCSMSDGAILLAPIS